jgi:hypothetical protein
MDTHLPAPCRYPAARRHPGTRAAGDRRQPCCARWSSSAWTPSSATPAARCCRSTTRWWTSRGCAMCWCATSRPRCMRPRATRAAPAVWAWCFVTSGPGMSNTVTGLLDALSDSVPVLCVSGQVATHVDRYRGLPGVRCAGHLARPVTQAGTTSCTTPTRWRRRCDALRSCHKRPPGPGAARHPQGRAGRALHDEPAGRRGACAAARAGNATVPARGARPRSGRRLDARSPAPGALWRRRTGELRRCALARALRELVQWLDAPCTLTLLGLGAYPRSQRRFLGMPGMHGTLEANLALHGADLIVCGRCPFR